MDNMEKEDKEFETFLGQFELREHRGFPQDAPVEATRRSHRWVWAAAAVIVASLVSMPLLRYFSQTGAPGAIIEARGDSSYKAGEAIAGGKRIRSGEFESLTLRLKDETRVEMRAQSEVSIDTANDGLRVRLNSGSILVSAAKQRDGHLYVETDDTVVSVVGTVFLVERTPLGTRVGVCEGEVEVRQGLELRKLIPGQQASTNPSMDGPLVEAIAWSSAASRFSSLLQPAPVSQQPGPAVPEKDQKEPPKEQPAPPKDEPKAEKPPSPPAPEPPRKKAPRTEEVAPTEPLALPRPAPGDTDAQWNQTQQQLHDTTCLMLLNQQKYSESIAECQAATKINPKDAYAWYWIGLSHRAAFVDLNKKYNDAVKVYNDNRTAPQLQLDDLRAVMRGAEKVASDKLNETLDAFATAAAIGGAAGDQALAEMKKLFPGTPEELTKLIASKRQ